MANYYFLGTLLPDLAIDEKPDLGFSEFLQLMSDNLSSHDLAKARTALNFYDIFNLRSYIKGEPLDPVGNLDAKALEEALVTTSVLPSYIFDYMAKYQSKEERLRHFPEMLARFFQEEIRKATGAFKNYLIMEREVRLLLVAFRAKKLGRDVIRELQYEDPEDEFVAQLIAEKDSPDYDPPEKYADFRPFWEKYHNDPLGFQKAFCEYRFRKIDEMVSSDLFSIDRILAYMVKLIVIEKWQGLNKDKGLQIVDSMLKEPL